MSGALEPIAGPDNEGPEGMTCRV